MTMPERLYYRMKGRKQKILPLISLMTLIGQKGDISQ
jgi:hypothetical protein